MKFLNKNILLLLILAMPLAHAGTNQPWYTRMFAGCGTFLKKLHNQYPTATIITGTAATTGLITSLAWYYFGVRPMKRPISDLQQQMLSAQNNVQQNLSNISEDLADLMQKKNKKIQTNQATLSSLKKDRATQQDKIAFAKARVANVSSRKLDDRIVDADKALYELAFKEIEINLDNVILQSELYSLSAIQAGMVPQKVSSL